MGKIEREMCLIGNELSLVLEMVNLKGLYGICYCIRESLEFIWEICEKSEKLKVINIYIEEIMGRYWDCLGKVFKVRRGLRIELFKGWGG